MYKLWKYCENYGRGGNVEGLFIATEKELESVCGEWIYFGEILGEYSEVEIKFERDVFEQVRIPDEVVLTLKKTMGTTLCGYNPLEYIKED